MCDSFNTPAALNVLLDLVSQTNIYFARSTEYNIGVIETIAVWVTRSLKMFGLGEGIAAGANGGIGWGNAGELVAESGDVGDSTIDAGILISHSLRRRLTSISARYPPSEMM